MIDLNTEEYSIQELRKQFNDGKAGVVGNCKIEVRKKTSEDHENAPDFKIIFIDKEGGQVDKAIYYPEPGNIKQLKFVGQTVVHIFHVCKGNDDQLPHFKDEKDMVDSAMALLRDSSNGFLANVVTNFGSGDEKYRKAFMEVRQFPKFFELDVDVADSKLFNSKSEFMERKEDIPTEDNIVFDSDNVNSNEDW